MSVKNIPDATLMRLVATILRKGSGKGFRLKTKNGEVTITYDEVVSFVEELAERMKNDEYIVIRRCDTCGNFNRSGKFSKRGWCAPSEFTSSKNTTDYCSGWVPMSPEQKRIKEIIDEHFGTL